MDESQIVLKVKRRDTGKKAVKAIRKEGRIPGIFYIKTGEAIPFEVEALDVRDIVYTSKIKIVNLQIEGEDDIRECVLKQVDFDPLSDKIKHIDLYGIIRGTNMHVEVPIILTGSAKGAREGGILQHSLRRVLIECLPKNLPNAIEVDVTDLEIGHSLYLKDIDVPNVDFLISPETTIASVVTPRVVKEIEVEGIKEGEEAAKGEEVAEGEEAKKTEESKKEKSE
jgi:large subunit ribosomal protein L25